MPPSSLTETAQSEPASGRASPASISVLAGWGALWGCAFGFGGLARPVVLAHHAYLHDLRSWLIVEIGLGVFFAALGALLAAVPLVLVTDALAAPPRRLRHAPWAIAIGAAPCVACGYVLVASVLELNILGWGALDLARRNLDSVAVCAGVLLLLTCCAYAMYLGVVALKIRHPARALGTMLGLVILVELCVLPIRGWSAPPGTEEPPHLVRSEGSQRPAPLLFVGIDGATWRVLGPLLDAGKLPTLEMLSRRGVHGETVAERPPYWSSPAWASIVTGHPLDETGVDEDLSMEVPGLPLMQVPVSPSYWLNPVFGWRRLLASLGLIQLERPPRRLVREAPFWELLSAAGEKTAVIRFRFTFPPDPRSTVMISNFVGTDHWNRAFGVVSAPAFGIAGPLDEQPILRRLFEPDAALSRGFREFFRVGDRQASSASGKAALDDVEEAFTIDMQTVMASEHVISRHPDLAAVAVYFGGFDAVCHALRKYRLPDAGSRAPLDADAELLGPLVDRYGELLDTIVARLVHAYRVVPNVVIASDHGFFDGWHDPQGFFLAAGPNVPMTSDSLKVSYSDVVPTILELTGFLKPPVLIGNSVFARGR